MLKVMFVCGFFAIIVIGIIAITTMELVAKYQTKKFSENHPEYFILRDAVIEKGNECFDYIKLIDQKKEAIDKALAVIPYLTDEEVEKVEEQLKEMRFELKKIKDEYRPIKLRHIELREKFNKYHKELVDKGEIKEYFLI